MDFPRTGPYLRRLEQVPNDGTFVTLAASALGAKFTAPTAAAAACLCIDINPSGTKVAYGGGTTPFVQMSPWDDRAAGGWGTRYGNPATLPPGAVNALAFHPSGKWLLVAGALSPFARIYPIQRNGWGTALADPATLPLGTVSSCAWSPDGNYLVLGQATGRVEVWAFDASGAGAWGAKGTSLSAILGSQTVLAAAWHPSGQYVAFGGSATGSLNLSIYQWTGSAFGTLLTNTEGEGISPAVSFTGGGDVTGAVNALAWSPDGANLAIGESATPFVVVYPFDQYAGERYGWGRIGPKFANPATLPAGSVASVAWGKRADGEIMVCAHTTTPFMTAYPWKADTGGFGTKFTDPVALPAGNGAGAAVSPTHASIVIAHATTPFITAYPFTTSVWSPQPATINDGPPGILQIDANSVNEMVIYVNGDGVVEDKIQYKPLVGTYSMPIPLPPADGPTTIPGQIAYFSLGSLRFWRGQVVWLDTVANNGRLVDSGTTGAIRLAGICLEDVDNSAAAETAWARVLMAMPFAVRPKADASLPIVRAWLWRE